MRVRVALGLALAVAAGALILDMSGRAPRLAGTDHVSPVAFVAVVSDGQELCQAQMVLPADAGAIKVLIGTYGKPVPELVARFLDARGRRVASGRLPSGGPEGDVSIPLGRTRASAVEGVLCIREKGVAKVVVGGEGSGPGPYSEQVAGRPQAGRIGVVYLRGGRESWWQLLPTLAERFGVGKAPLFGTWTLPVMALLLLGVWVGAVRLMARELG